jgi:predicted GIY-YIG superfamily endonuclease
MLNMVEMFKAMDRERQLKELEKQKEEELVERIANRVVEKLKELNNDKAN